MSLFKLYLAVFLTKFGDRCFDMVVPLALADFFPQNLSGAAMIAAFEAFFCMVGFPYVGSFISRQKSRIKSVVFFVGMQSLAVLMSFICLFVLSSFTISAALIWMVLVLISISEALSTLTSKGADISVIRDWLPLIVTSDDLTVANSAMARIDLGTKIFSPILVSLLFLVGSDFAIYSVAALNIISFIPEVILLASLHRTHKEKLCVETSKPKEYQNRLSQLLSDLKLSVRHPLWPVLLAHSLLYATVLSPQGILMTSFLATQGIQPVVLSGVRVLNAIFGISCTFWFKKLVQKPNFGLKKTGLLFNSWQVCLTTMAFVALIYSLFNSEWSYYLLVGFISLIVVGRFGLYGFSLVEVQIVQKFASVTDRPILSGVEQSLSQFVAFLVFVVSIVVSDPSFFFIPVIVSLLALYTCWLVYFLWFRRHEGDQKDEECFKESTV
ncbi:hypothetical protein P9112_014037 [Eukaryota sp. TZLM1-RC]